MTLTNFYKLVFSLVQHHKYSITEVENLMPFEREIYVNMLLRHIEELEHKKQKKI